MTEQRFFFVDKPAMELDDLISSEAASLRAVRSVAELLDRAHGGSSRPCDGLAGLAAAEYLEKLIEVISRDVSLRANGYSPARWLWYLRRLPDRFLREIIRPRSGMTARLLSL